MKIFVLAALSVMVISSVASAQCGCGAPVYQPMVRVAPAPYIAPAPLPMPAPMPVAPQGPAKVSYVNTLQTPIQRETYTLNYAIHLTDGRVLLADVLPKGYTATGTEPGGYNGRKMISNQSPEALTVVDPANNQTVATLTKQP